MKGFNSIVWKWFGKAIGEPTEAQQLAWPEIKKGRNVLISAPTGSGKTLSAFFAVIDDLVQRDLKHLLEEKTYVVYVSPLKALSNDIEKNLQLPIRGLKEELKTKKNQEININVGLRTGDTTPYQRTAMFKKHPHILVSTPESLYILLTSVNGRKMLSNVETVIVDEIHALVQDKRGSHLALSLERLEHLTLRKLVRIGLSATQKPIEKVACFLTGNPNPNKLDCHIVNVGLKRKLELSIDMPRSPLLPIMANEVWEEVYNRLEQLIKTHKTTLIFVHTRRLAERMSHNLANRLGKENVAAHHGSMSKDHRLDAETRLKEGHLKALVATASLELGIDIGGIDLVCQIGSPRSIASLLQRVGRSGHHVGGVPKGIIFPLSRDELVECVAVINAIRHGELDELIIPEKPIDILAQQLVAELAGDDYTEDEMYGMVTKAYPYRNLERSEFDEIVTMLSDGYATRRGRRGAYIHHDVVNKKLRARKNARITSLVSGGAIPDNFDYDVIMEPTSTFVGTINEDFAVESIPGDIFQLGNNSWRLLKIESGKVRVEDAKGAPPTIPFWLGEAPGRTKELSEAVSRIRVEISERLGDLSELKKLEELEEGEQPDEGYKSEALDWLMKEVGIGFDAADQMITYLAAGKSALGIIPNQDTLVMERFFDEAGDMHLVIHSPFGSRLNRAWGLSLRKRFCRKFNFELQAAATDDNIIMSLGSTHSFPIEEVYQYLNPKTVRDVLIQALLDAPMFEVRWRWNASRALAIIRRQGGKKVPPQIQRSNSEDLIALVFPDQLACLENIVGEREVPDHPLVNQTIHDCLTEAMDIDGLEALLTRIKSGEIELLAKDLREPSPMAQEIINARPYAYLDPGEAAERRTNNIQSRNWLDPADARDLAALDFAAIQAVKIEAWPQVSNADELHDSLVLAGFLSEEEGQLGDGLNSWETYFQELIQENRVTSLVTEDGSKLWVAAERIPQFKTIYPGREFHPSIVLPEKLASQDWEESKALIEVVRGRLEIMGPVLVSQLADLMKLSDTQIETAMLALENDGFVFRGFFNPGAEEREWCERRLLARIHRYTIQKLRSEIEAVSAADYMRFLLQWHGLSGESKLEGPRALEDIISKLEGYEAPAAAWEGSIIPDRLKDYDYMWLDVLCISGKITWGRFRPIVVDHENGKKAPSPVKNTPLCLLGRGNIALWKGNSEDQQELSSHAYTIISILQNKGASFFNDLVTGSKLFDGQVEEALAELVSHGLATSDSFSGLRALLVPLKYKTGRRRAKKEVFTMDQAGRWTLIDQSQEKFEDRREYLEEMCMALLRRYGVLFRKLADREQLVPPWRELVRVLRILEARGLIRGGRFVQGVWGEQFALPEALTLLRKVKKEPKEGELISISAADPLNLTGIITPGRKITAYFGNRILYRDGVPVAVTEGKEVKMLEEFVGDEKWKIHHAVIERKIPPKLRHYLGKGIL
ncbi:MAG: DEAD/DEAH box helicase [Bacteroidetes bacterium]|nr:DEAD/DEAH box helicase [Bacteroidota bacterium]